MFLNLVAHATIFGESENSGEDQVVESRQDSNHVLRVLGKSRHTLSTITDDLMFYTSRDSVHIVHNNGYLFMQISGIASFMHV